MAEPSPDRPTPDRPSYADLRARGAKEFLTDGPNSGGVAGLLATETHVWWFQADWTPEITDGPIAASDFVRRYRDEDGRGIADAVAFLVGRGVGAAHGEEA